MKGIQRTLFIIIIALIPCVLIFPCDGEDYPVTLNNPSELMNAITNGDEALALELLAGGADPFYRLEYTMAWDESHLSFSTPLSLAIQWGMADLVDGLIEKGATLESTYHYDFIWTLYSDDQLGIEAPSLNGQFPIEFLYAIYKENPRIMESLLTLYDDHDSLPVQYFIYTAVRNNMDHLLEYYGGLGWNEWMERDTAAGLMNYASEQSLDEVLQVMLEGQWVPDYFSRGGSYPFKLNLPENSLETQLLLMQYCVMEIGQDSFNNMVEELFLQSSIGSRSSILLHYWQMLEPMISVEEERQGLLNRALWNTVNNSSIKETSGALLELGAQVNSLNGRGKTLLMESLELQGYILEFLLEQGADPDMVSSHGKSALQMAYDRSLAQSYGILLPYSSVGQQADVASIFVSSCREDRDPRGIFESEGRGRISGLPMRNRGMAWIEGEQGSGLGSLIRISLDDRIMFNRISFETVDTELELNSLRSIGLRQHSSYIPGFTVELDGHTGWVDLGRVYNQEEIEIYLHQAQGFPTGEFSGIRNLQFYLDDKKVNLSMGGMETEISSFRQTLQEGELSSRLNHWNNEHIYFQDKIHSTESGLIYDGTGAEFHGYNLSPGYGRNTMNWHISMSGGEGVHMDFHNGEYHFFLSSSGVVGGANDAWLVKVDPYTLEVDQWRYGDLGNDSLIKVLPMDNGEYILAMKSSSFEGVDRLLLLSINSTGEILWQRTYSPDFEGGRDIRWGDMDLCRADGDHFALRGEHIFMVFSNNGDLYSSYSIAGLAGMARSNPGEITLMTTGMNVMNFFTWSLEGNSFSPSRRFVLPINHLSGEVVQEESRATIYPQEMVIAMDGEIILDYVVNIYYGHNDNWGYEGIFQRGAHPFTQGSFDYVPVEVEVQNTQLEPMVNANPIHRFIYSGNLTSGLGNSISSRYSGVRVRMEPDLQSPVVGSVGISSGRITLLDMTEERHFIGPMEDYWYKIEFSGSEGERLQGWAFGYFFGTNRALELKSRVEELAAQAQEDQWR